MSPASGMDVPGCGGMNRLGGGELFTAMRFHLSPRSEARGRVQLNLSFCFLTGMSGGGFGGMDSMGSMGGFGGRDMAPVGRMGGE